MNGGKVLVAGVDTQLVQKINTQLKSLGLEPVWTPTSEDVVRSFVRHVPEAVILWDAAPGFDGWETARLIRAISDTPIIFLSDSADRLTRKRALQVGDEVLSPPWQWERLPARLGALLRRAANTGLALPDLYDD